MRLDSSFCCVFLNLRLAFLKAYPLHISLTSTQSDISDLPQGIGTSLYYASRRTGPLYRKFLYLGVAFLDGLRRFLLRHGWSLLSVRRHRKRTVDLLGCPDGSIKFSWGYPLKELRSSAPLFISSWIMVAKSFFTLSLSVFAPAFSTYTVLSPNLKVA